MARTIRNDHVDLYRYMPDPGWHAYGPYDTMAWPRRHQKEHGGKGTIQKLAPSFDADGNFYCLTWVNVE